MIDTYLNCDIISLAFRGSKNRFFGSADRSALLHYVEQAF